MMMTLARMYPVETQAISSRLAPRFPIMSGSATLTIELSMTCISAASTTAKAMRYLCGAPSYGAASGSTSGPFSLSGSALGSTALATDIGGYRCKARPSWVGFGFRSGILLSRVDARLTRRGGVGSVQRFLNRPRSRNLGPGKYAVLLVLGADGRILNRFVVAAAGQKKREDAAGYGDSAD